ncbi:MAG: lycopene cyclase domain-containing protein [Chitinophagaceae bacterium]|nr:MAG: lycopene cyclase domain-containing protein [Chitinophagaceae bacterium]
MNASYTYFLILAASLAGPLALSFDKKVAFYKKWKFLFPAMILPAVFYIIWDSYFTSRGVWSFNESYISGVKYFGLPIEEILFFFVVPYCCVFIYECIRCYFPQIKEGKWAGSFLKMLAVVLLATGLLSYQLYYTSWTFILLSFFLLLFFLLKKYFTSFHSAVFLIAYAVILIPFLVVNGFLTAIPVVLYNDAENLGVRLYTIPFEDVFYGMLLIFLNIIIFEQLRSRL